METTKERLERMVELQKHNLGSFQRLNSVAFSAFEQIARKNYELMGDMVEYAVAQARTQAHGGAPQERYERQMQEARRFAEKIGARASEYGQLVGEMRDGIAAPTAPAISEAATRNATKSATEAVAVTREIRQEAYSTLVAGKADGKKASSKKSADTGKKAAGKKSTAKKSADASKKAAGKKSTAEKSADASKKTAGKKTAGKKSTARKSADTGKKAAGKKSTARKSADAGKKAAGKKSTAKKSTGAGKKAAAR